MDPVDVSRPRQSIARPRPREPAFAVLGMMRLAMNGAGITFAPFRGEPGCVRQLTMGTIRLDCAL